MTSAPRAAPAPPPAAPPGVPRNMWMVAQILDRAGYRRPGAPAVHITGTKGKGSASALTASILRAQGYRTGLFTKPWLHSWREFITVDGQPMTDGQLGAMLARLNDPVEQVSGLGWGRVVSGQFLTAMMLLHFQEMATDFNVVETINRGGQDSTNVIWPVVSMIMAIGLDHLGFLGNTLEEIATEKAGIIKPGVPAISSPQSASVMEVLRWEAASRRARLIEVGRDVGWQAGAIHRTGGQRAARGQDVRVGGRLGTYDLYLPLLGDYQLENTAAAIAAIEALREAGHQVSNAAIRDGVASVRWPCRLEVLDPGLNGPLVVADVAHNPMSAARLRDELPRYFEYDRVALILDVNQGRNVPSVVSEFARLRPHVVVASSRLGSLSSAPEPLMTLWRQEGIEPRYAASPAEALPVAMNLAGRNGLVLATGCFTVPAAVKEALRGITPELELPF